MRIRKRPSSLLSSLPPLHHLTPDPSSSSHQVLTPNGTAGTKYTTNGIREGLLLQNQPAGKQGDQVLHPAGNLSAESVQLSYEPKSRKILAAENSDPCQTHVGQVVKNEKLKIEMEDCKDDVVHQGDSNNMRINENSSALVSVPSARKKKRNGGIEKNMPVNSRQAKLKTASTGGGASLLYNCTGINGSDIECSYNTNSEASEKSELAVNGTSGSNNVSRKRKSPAVLMEGSRCSRVNGRGWRCCQQTLVGYSLCEHHLGKGRLRSMNSVRGQLGTSKQSMINDNECVQEDDMPSSISLATTMPQIKQEVQQVDTMLGDMEEEENETIEKMKRKKFGMVKARSLCSLLEPQLSASTSLAQTPEVAQNDREAMV